MSSLKRAWPQLFPSKGTLTASTIPSQTGKVVIVTGATAGIGLELIKALYHAGATVYLAARNKDKADAAIADLQASSSSVGSLHFLPLDLNDLRTVKPFTQAFLAAESRLDLLFNNAGVANQSPSRRTQQGLEPHIGINCVAPYLLTQLLAPLLTATAALTNTRDNGVRVVWSTSMLVEFLAPAEGVPPVELEHPSADQNRNYAISKAGNWFLADRLARQLGERGVVSVAQNPGNIYTGIFDEAPRLTVWLSKPLYYSPVEGAQTMLWAGLAEEVEVKDGGRFVIPFGRWHPCPREELMEAMKEGDEGGKGYGRVFEEWCAKQVEGFR
ncbi:hypothetical protein N8T08_010453 [Aspergillus melleus]|uniref:Uncharacterized protein n=1 Tax=Aspergillus melleus TaxID=138277 RepID=A0ACC3ARD1_9EURO|nr:hypothetical protein N8T08_010453 [Aspergillus melleus]